MSFIYFKIFSFIVKDWGECSVPCGEGIRVREVKCQIFLEFSKTVANLPDDKCPGPKPMTTEICYAGLCDSRPAAVKEKIAIAIDDGLKADAAKDNELPNAPTPQGLIGKYQQDGLVKAMALQSNYGGQRGIANSFYCVIISFTLKYISTNVINVITIKYF